MTSIQYGYWRMGVDPYTGKAYFGDLMGHSRKAKHFEIDLPDVEFLDVDSDILSYTDDSSEWDFQEMEQDGYSVPRERVERPQKKDVVRIKAPKTIQERVDTAFRGMHLYFQDTVLFTSFMTAISPFRSAKPWLKLISKSFLNMNSLSLAISRTLTKMSWMKDREVWRKGLDEVDRIARKTVLGLKEKAQILSEIKDELNEMIESCSSIVIQIEQTESEEKKEKLRKELVKTVKETRKMLIESFGGRNKNLRENVREIVDEQLGELTV